MFQRAITLLILMKNLTDLEFDSLTLFESFYVLYLIKHFDDRRSYSAKTVFRRLFEKNEKLKSSQLSQIISHQAHI